MTYLAAPEKLETERFTVRSYLPGDGPLLAEATDASYRHLRRFMPWAKETLPAIEARRIAREFRGRFLLASDFPLAVVAPDGSRFLGSTGFHLREGSLNDRIAEVGMWIRANEAGRGLGTEVLVEVLRWGFDEWPWEVIFWRCSTQNHASIRTAEKAGMAREGVLRRRLAVRDEGYHDMALFSATRCDWRAPRRR